MNKEKQFVLGTQFLPKIPLTEEKRKEIMSFFKKEIKDKMDSFLNNPRFEKYLKEKGILMISCQFLTKEEYQKVIGVDITEE